MGRPAGSKNKKENEMAEKQTEISKPEAVVKESDKNEPNHIIRSGKKPKFGRES